MTECDLCALWATEARQALGTVPGEQLFREAKGVVDVWRDCLAQAALPGPLRSALTKE